jgi:ATP-dependent DNA helicase DinG
MVGGDLPGWLPTLFRRAGSTALTDRRGECVYAGCPHYRKCFIERAARASEQADIVIANHALVMILARAGPGEGRRWARLIFDEGHHLFDAADSTFAAALTGQEAIEFAAGYSAPSGRRAGAGAASRRGCPTSRAMTRRAHRAIEAASAAAAELPATAGSAGWRGMRRARPDRAAARSGADHGLCPGECAGRRLWARNRRRRTGPAADRGSGASGDRGAREAASGR